MPSPFLQQKKIYNVEPRYGSKRNGGQPSVEDYQSRFRQAIQNGLLDAAQSLLHKHPDLLRKTSSVNQSPAHLAVVAKQADMLQYLLQLTKDPNETDSKGYTLLHAAVAENEPFIIKELLKLPEVEVAATLPSGDTALHLAVRLDHHDALHELLLSARISVDAEGNNGKTPLHVAAALNHLECTKILIRHGASLTALSDTGEQPTHRAADAGSVDVLQYILQLPDCPVEHLLSFKNEEEATPLHYGVNSGNRDIVRILLEHGAPIDAQMFEQSTPLHLACARGFTDLVELMQAHCPKKFDKVLAMPDAQGMTPMHRAAMFNYWDLLRLLAEKRAPVNAQDSLGRTVLVLAASCGSWDAVSELLSLGADPSISTAVGQNFIHMTVSIGDDPERFRDDIKKESLLPLINGPDSDGLTPLHHAAQHGFASCCEALIRMGASLHAKDKQSRSPLHHAAANGRYNTVKALLRSTVTIINDVDAAGLTALHMAAENGHIRIVNFLMSRAATMLRDYHGCLPLHLACAMDQQDVAEMIISAHPTLLDATEKEGNTPLHVAAQHNALKTVAYLLQANAQLTTNDHQLTALDLAIMNKQKDAVLAMIGSDRWTQIFTQPSSLFKWPVLGLIEELPGVMLKVLDKCATTASSGSLSKNFWVRYDFELLEPKTETKGLKIPSKRHPLQVLNHMTAYKRTELLEHPVCTRYLDSKWHTYGVYFHFSGLLLYITFVTLLTYLILQGIEMDLRPNVRKLDLARIKTHLPDFNGTKFGPIDLTAAEEDLTTLDGTLVALVIIFAAIHLAKKGLQLIQQKWRFIFEVRNYFELTLYIATLVFCAAALDGADYYMSWETQWLVGATAVFFTWVNLFFCLQRYGEIGLHVIILLRVMRTLVQAMCVLFVVVLAFSLTFTVLNPMKILPDDPDFYEQDHDKDHLDDIYFTSYSTLQTSILRVSDQMIGDADVIANFITPIQNKVLLFPNATYILAMLSMGIVTMLVQALINGLTLGDIRKVRDTLILRRKKMQVDLHTEIEEKLPQRLLNRWRKTSVMVYPNRLKSRFLKGVFRYLTNPNIEVDNDDDTDGTLNKQNGDWEKNAAAIRTELDKQDKITDSLTAKLEQEQELLRLIAMQLGLPLENDTGSMNGIKHQRTFSRYVSLRRTASRRQRRNDKAQSKSSNSV
ncbi:transient receptor potential cation channel subfamily A member 1-like [Paramacrobiotus metropolitanus]|uniref:transient receptor potential cation channel subfamily A member 1-like n=1 Tax=Paramacrobiotus metropolitanus TaxID=2943436 RepID=UPI002445DE53|nr:transient receptor potential cation channel subfamily A member 1-like [Paramacrobiotus metropolitanus]